MRERERERRETTRERKTLIGSLRCTPPPGIKLQPKYVPGLELNLNLLVYDKMLQPTEALGHDNQIGSFKF